MKYNIKFYDISFNVDPVEGIFKFVSLQISLDHKEINIIALYRSPSRNFVNFCHSLEQILSKNNCFQTNYFICGDFVNFDQNNVRPDSRHLINLFAAYGFPMCVKEFTRVQKVIVNQLYKYTCCGCESLFFCLQKKF